MSSSNEPLVATFQLLVGHSTAWETPNVLLGKFMNRVAVLVQIVPMEPNAGNYAPGVHPPTQNAVPQLACYAPKDLTVKSFTTYSRSLRLLIVWRTGPRPQKRRGNTIGQLFAVQWRVVA